MPTGKISGTDLIIAQSANSGDGFDITAGVTTKRKLTVTGADITLTGSGTNVYTFPTAADTLVGLAATQTLTAKTLTTPTIGDFTNATHDHTTTALGGMHRAFSKLTAQFSTGSTTLVTTGLTTATLPASTTWNINVVMVGNVDVSTAGAIFTAVCANATSVAATWAQIPGSSAAGIVEDLAGSGTLTAAYVKTATTDYVIIASFVVVMNTAGTFDIQVKKVTSNNIRIQAGATLIGQRVA